MPLRVPTVDGPSVQERPLQGGFQRSLASPELLGGGQARQLGEAGRAMQEVGAQIQEREDADMLMRAETEVKAKYLEWEGEAKQRKGQAAWGVAKEAGQWWDKEASRVSEQLSNPRQKYLFGQKVAQMRGLSVGQFSGYEAGERRASLDQSAQASIVSSINMAAANPLNVELLNATKGDILKRNQVRAQINGWAPEMAEAQRMTDLTNLHKQVIQGLVRDNPEAAQAYFEANKAEINGSEHAEVGAFAAKATATKVGEAAAEAAWMTLGPKGDRDAVQLDKLEQAIRDRKDIGDEAKKSAIAALKERTVAFKDARRERDDALEAKVNIAVMQGAGATQVQRMPEFMQMDGEKQRRLMDFIENRQLRRVQQAAAQESRAAASEAREQTRLTRQGMGAYLVYSNPDNLAGMSEAQVVNLLPVLGNELTQHLMQQKRALAKPEKLAEARMDAEDFNHVGRQMGLPIDKAKSENDKALVGEVKFRVEQVIAATQQRAGKTLTREEKMTVMRQEMARTVSVSTWGGFSSEEVPVIGLSPDQAAKVVIPAADRAQLAEAMKIMYQRTKSPDYEPTPENLRRFYLLSKSPAAGLILPKK